MPGFDTSRGECNASIVGSTEGALYKNHLTEESVLWYWRKPLCRQVPLYFEKEVQKGPFECLKYVLRENVYDRMENETEDCYKGFFQKLPDGFSDLSKCFYGKNFEMEFDGVCPKVNCVIDITVQKNTKPCRLKFCRCLEDNI